jgi:4-carboxymuconolactone decarboxylase
MAKDLFEQGRRNRADVLGAEYVRASLEEADDFSRDFQRFITEYNWGYNWGRNGLSTKHRCLLNLGILAVLNRPAEWEQHFRGSLKHGLTLAELEDALIHIGVYAGMPAAVQSFRIASKVLAEMRETGELPAGS